MTLNSNVVERAIWEWVVAKPDNQVVVRSDWVQQTTPSAPTAFMNGVYRCVLNEAQIHTRIRETIEHYANLKLPFRWKTSSSMRPANLPALLLEHGLLHKDTLFGLQALPGQLKIKTISGVDVRPLNAETLEDWLHVQATAWKVPPPGIAYMRKASVESFAQSDEREPHFVAYWENEPVASAAIRFYDDYAFFLGAAVREEFRGRGIYRALLAHRLKLVEGRQLSAVVHCLQNTSAPICLKLGFTKVCEIFSFENQ